MNYVSSEPRCDCVKLWTPIWATLAANPTPYNSFRNAWHCKVGISLRWAVLSTKPVHVERIQKKGMRYFIERRRRRRRQSSSSSFRLTSQNRMEEANSLGLSRGDEVECYMTYLKRRDQVKMMGLGQRAKVLLLHSHVGNISTRTFPLDSRAFTDSTGKRIWKKPQLMVVEGLKSRRFDGLLNNFCFFLLVKGIFS